MKAQYVHIYVCMYVSIARSIVRICIMHGCVAKRENNQSFACYAVNY